MSKTIVVNNSFDATVMKKITKSSLNRLRKDALVDMAVTFGWNESHATKPLNKMIKEDFINFILQMADVFKDDISLEASLVSQDSASALAPSLLAPSKTPSLLPSVAASSVAPSVSKTPSLLPSVAPSSVAPSVSKTPSLMPSVVISSVASSLLPSVALSSVAPSVSKPSVAPSVSKTPPSVSKAPSVVQTLVPKQLAPPTEPPVKKFRADPVGGLSKNFVNLHIDEREKVTRDLVSMTLGGGGGGAVPKKRPPPLNLPLVESVVLDRRQRVDDVRLPQLVESTMPPTRDFGVFQFPEKTESSESGVRLKNAKELSDVLLEIKERNSDDLTALDDIDSLLSRAFGVVS